MTKYFLLFNFLICTTHTYSSTNFSLKNPKANEVFFTFAETNVNISLADYIRLSSSDLKKLTVHKLNIKEIIVFKITQKKIKKAISKDGSIDMLAFNKQAKKPFKWHWGGFFLGLLMPVLGLIITAFFKDEQRKNRIDSAAIGTCVFGIIFLAIVLSSF